jgi:activating signal cointegrator complex subunit 3
MSDNKCISQSALFSAGRPQFDREGISCVFVEESKKNFYKKFLYLPFPLESHLSTRLADNINAEVAIGTISTVADAIGYLSWTFFFRRVKLNPSYYGASSTQAEDIDSFFISTMRETLIKLYDVGCIDINGEDIGMLESYTGISSSFLGRAACTFYLSYKTPSQMRKSIVSMKEMFYTLTNQIQQGSSSNEKDIEPNGRVFQLEKEVETFGVSAILYHLAHTHEFDELPVRHNEEFLNIELSKQLPWGQNMAIKKGKSSVKNNETLIDEMKDSHTK